MVYENICNICNERASGKEEIIGGSNPDIPSIYVGESSRTIFERAKEHWEAAEGSAKAKAGAIWLSTRRWYIMGSHPTLQ